MAFRTCAPRDSISGGLLGGSPPVSWSTCFLYRSYFTICCTPLGHILINDHSIACGVAVLMVGGALENEMCHASAAIFVYRHIYICMCVSEHVLRDLIEYKGEVIPCHQIDIIGTECNALVFPRFVGRCTCWI